jgi:hypothetical protein
MHQKITVIKGISAIILLASALYSGYARFPLWSILAIGLLFTAAYIHGKWYAWKPMFAARTLRFWQSLVVTWMIQCIMVLILYLIGSGIGRLVGAK